MSTRKAGLLWPVANNQQYPCDWCCVCYCWFCLQSSWLIPFAMLIPHLQGGSFSTGFITPVFPSFLCIHFFPWESVGEIERGGVTYAWWSEEAAMCAQGYERAQYAVRERILWMFGCGWLRDILAAAQSYCISTGNLWEKMIYRLRERERKTAAGILQSSDIQIAVCFNSWFDDCNMSLLYCSSSGGPIASLGQNQQSMK